MSDFEVLRRIAERGIALAQNEIGGTEPRGHLDLWTHLSDEIERAREHYGIEDPEKLVTIEVEIDDELLFEAAMMAHAEGITLNQYIINALRLLIEEDAAVYSDDDEGEEDDTVSTPNVD